MNVLLGVLGVLSCALLPVEGGSGRPLQLDCGECRESGGSGSCRAVEEKKRAASCKLLAATMKTLLIGKLVKAEHGALVR